MKEKQIKGIYPDNHIREAMHARDHMEWMSKFPKEQVVVKKGKNNTSASHIIFNDSNSSLLYVG